MQNLINNLKSQGVKFEEYQENFSHLGRSTSITLLKVIIEGKGRLSSPISMAKETFVPAYNEAQRLEAIKTIEAEISKEEKNKNELEKAQNLQITKLQTAIDNQKIEFEKIQNEAEKARKIPLLRFTAKMGIGLGFLVSIILMALNYVNASYFLGESIHWSFLIIFSIVLGASYLYFSLTRNSVASFYVGWIIPFELVIAAVVKPFLGESLIIKENFYSYDMVALILFLIVYCVQLYHVCHSVTKLFNSSDLLKSKEIEHIENIKNSLF